MLDLYNSFLILLLFPYIVIVKD